MHVVAANVRQLVEERTDAAAIEIHAAIRTRVVDDCGVSFEVEIFQVGAHRRAEMYRSAVSNLPG